MRRHVVDLAVGDQHRAGDALARHVGQRAGERGYELRAVVGQPGVGIGRAGMDDAQIEIAELLQAPGHVGERLVGIAPALADAHAGRVVDDDDGDVALRLALLLDQRRVGEDEQQQGQRRQPPGEAAGAPPGAESQDERRQHRKGDDRRPGQQRREGE
jgi:hypothetical protein